MTWKESWDRKIGNNKAKNSTWNVDKVSISFIFTNFPSDIDSKKLWTICKKNISLFLMST